ncbi:anaerobic ribonucleoside-triphosphate reductase activating protein [Chitinimonas koreensis]|uniref:anaerobic ribonucleoside-triphosphate reductase activating protein n=1 Tax=Chitinimonas koreensis TaxID=356302 RepID=UPI000425D517|nr:anaerobic ribonucleoside-triphosphate reductase activating protein [Chitinimonas koreensis]QNM95125.1 anaerobic ribonucleoside-triphosphate reductase activating protein [Chitinimonas koreensis]
MSAASSTNRPARADAIPIRLVAPAPAVVGAGEPAVAGLVPFSSVDWPGRLSAVLFIGGCPWRCRYCHNPHLQTRHAAYRWAELYGWLESRRGLLDAVVFSGGEPLSESRLPELMAAVKSLGFQVGLHSAGIYPGRLATVLPLLDWVGLDIKARADGYDALTGRSRSYWPAAVSLEMLLASDCAFECRTTWDPEWLSETELLELARELAERGVRHYAVQARRSSPGAVPAACLSDDTLDLLREWFDGFDYR